ncbi:flagellar brake protein [Saccharospirillum alexandrii]|uniref:flagellar brake protein n=1 Tax=Saccharospirillum alexandrii TaxID=2448477 RepID=UPI000FD8D4C5|nr:flagellar brake protein [Saccharospirillum alexandrii]
MADKPETKTATFESLQLLPGQPLQLEIDGYTTERDRSILVGYRPGKSVIVTTPLAHGHPISVKLDTNLNVRLFANKINGACAFRTHVIHVSVSPFPHLHLAMPNQLFLGEVRKAVRAKVSVHATLVYQGERNNSEIIDLSTDGGRLRARVQAIDPGEVITLITKLNLGSVEKVMRLQGIVRSFVLDGDKGTSTIGLQWQKLEENDAIALQAYVLTRLHDNPH